MFSGIVEANSSPTQIVPRDQVVELHLKRPSNFNDLSIGDSIAVDGVCLTLEGMTQQSMQFAIAAETLHITTWAINWMENHEFNLERSVRISDRIHGHLVSGHVDALGTVESLRELGEGLAVSIKFPESMAKYLWQKGSVTINGVSLTINSISQKLLDVCLIPETLKRTNLRNLRKGDKVNLEADMVARALMRAVELGLLTTRGNY